LRNSRSYKNPSGKSEGNQPAKRTGDPGSGTPPKRTGEGEKKRTTNRTGEGAGRGTAKSAGRGTAKSAGRGSDRYPVKSGTVKSGKNRTAAPEKKPGGGREVRLNKYIANSGICSRREADKLITAGLITVNGKRITELGSKVSAGDDVRYNGERIRNERKVYLVLNKPKDYVTTTEDPRERKTVMLLVQHACPERIYPVGRLDRNTTGVLLFTNDGEMAKKLTHPSYNKKKIYHVFLDKAVTAKDLRTLAEGIDLEDGFIQPDAISYVGEESKREIGLEIHSGRNRIVRRMFESLGYRVTKLDRVYFAGLTKKNLPRGKWRFLTENEINRLRMNAYE
jgi:23S rRNA pseudouridine2605 synthase